MRSDWIETTGRKAVGFLWLRFVSALVWSLVTGAVYAVWGNYMVDEVGYTPAQMTPDLGHRLAVRFR